MSADQLVIAPAAKNDLKDLYQYGFRKWGKARSDSYLAALKNRLWSLTKQPLMGIERPELLPDSEVYTPFKATHCFTELPPIGLKSSAHSMTVKIHKVILNSSKYKGLPFRGHWAFIIFSWRITRSRRSGRRRQDRDRRRRATGSG